MASGSPTWLIAFVTIIGVRYVIDLALTRKAKRTGGKLSFDVTSPVKFGFIVGPPFFFGLAVLAIIQHEPCWLDLIFLLFVTIALVAWPRLIVVDHESVSCHVWWWTKSIPWSQVTSVCYYTASLSTQVTGSNGIKIVHTGFHADSARFREEITKRSPVHEIEQVDKIFSK